jgi:hypothetical protein
MASGRQLATSADRGVGPARNKLAVHDRGGCSPACTTTTRELMRENYRLRGMNRSLSDSAADVVLLGRKGDIEQFRGGLRAGFTADFLNLKGTMCAGKRGPRGWKWSRNRRFMQTALHRGQPIWAVTDPTKPLFNGGNTFQSEIRFLADRGHTWSARGDHWLLVLAVRGRAQPGPHRRARAPRARRRGRPATCGRG